MNIASISQIQNAKYFKKVNSLTKQKNNISFSAQQYPSGLYADWFVSEAKEMAKKPLKQRGALIAEKLNQLPYTTHPDETKSRQRDYESLIKDILQEQRKPTPDNHELSEEQKQKLCGLLDKPDQSYSSYNNYQVCTAKEVFPEESYRGEGYMIDIFSYPGDVGS